MVLKTIVRGVGTVLAYCAAAVRGEWHAWREAIRDPLRNHWR
jgi:hypothetical protein